MQSFDRAVKKGVTGLGVPQCPEQGQVAPAGEGSSRGPPMCQGQEVAVGASGPPEEQGQ